MSVEERATVEQQVAAKVQALAAVQLGTKQINNNTNATGDPLAFVRTQVVLIESIESIVGQQMSGEAAVAQQELQSCQSNDEAISRRLADAQVQLTSARKRFDDDIRSFAHAAKSDTGNRMTALAKFAAQNAKVRENLRDSLELLVTASEMVAMSICINDCSAHGTCWSGVCRCDDGWGGDICSEPEDL